MRLIFLHNSSHKQLIYAAVLSPATFLTHERLCTKKTVKCLLPGPVSKTLLLCKSCPIPPDPWDMSPRKVFLILLHINFTTLLESLWLLQKKKFASMHSVVLVCEPLTVVLLIEARQPFSFEVQPKSLAWERFAHWKLQKKRCWPVQMKCLFFLSS